MQFEKQNLSVFAYWFGRESDLHILKMTADAQISDVKSLLDFGTKKCGDQTIDRDVTLSHQAFGFA